MLFALFQGLTFFQSSFEGMPPCNTHTFRSKRTFFNCCRVIKQFLLRISVYNFLAVWISRIGNSRVGNQNFNYLRLNYSKIARAMPVDSGSCDWLKSIKVTYYILGFCYVVMIGLCIPIWQGCQGNLPVPSAILGGATILRLLWIFGSSISQAATASTMLLQQSDNFVVDNAVRHKRRMAYRCWLRWSRFGTFVTILQVVGTMFVAIVILKKVGHGHISPLCQENTQDNRRNILVASFLGIAVLSTVAQCCAGSNVLKWRSFYAMHDGAWKAHYSEMFDHGIREVLCCLGRAKYLSVLEDDEVHSVAGLLGELVAYRATGAGHLEFLAGIALLQSQGQTQHSFDQYPEAPEDHIREAVLLQPFAEAAYTGPLLDFGRNPIIFPCVWVYRQGILSPWSRNKRPILQGDNWWRGHAAAYLKFVNLPPNALRKGRVNQAKREAAYFVVVAHHLKCVIIAVRGTETPEDLLTDGLCRECMLSEADLEGLLGSNLVSNNLKDHVAASFPHYGHSGIVEAARELCIQLDGNVESEDSAISNNCYNDSQNFMHQGKGFLSSILGPDGECYGYALRFVGHSLGGAIGALTGIMLHKRFPNLHVYGYGVLPCVDATLAEACSSFVTSIIYNNEFSSRLSVKSILRLRQAALETLAADSSTDSAILAKLARSFVRANRCLSYKTTPGASVPLSMPESSSPRERKHKTHQRRLKHKLKGGICVCSHASSCVMNMPQHSSTGPLKKTVKKLHGSCENELQNDSDGQIDKSLSIQKISKNVIGTDQQIIDSDQQTSPLPTGFEANDDTSHKDCTILIEDSDTENQKDQNDAADEDSFTVKKLPFDSTPETCVINVDIDTSSAEPVEMFVPGLVIHIVPETKHTWPTWKSWKWFLHEDVPHRAVLRHRESFKDIVVDPSMFLDHMPWRCHYAMKKVLQTWDLKGHMNGDIQDSFHSV